MLQQIQSNDSESTLVNTNGNIIQLQSGQLMQVDPQFVANGQQIMPHNIVQIPAQPGLHFLQADPDDPTKFQIFQVSQIVTPIVADKNNPKDKTKRRSPCLCPNCLVLNGRNVGNKRKFHICHFADCGKTYRKFFKHSILECRIFSNCFSSIF